LVIGTALVARFQEPRHTTGFWKAAIRELSNRRAAVSRIYGVETKVLNQAVKRNAEKFPQDFMFILTRQEFAILKSQIVTSSWGGVRRALPYAFTEHGAMMAANVLKSPRAAQMSEFVVRAFVRMRALLAGDRQLAKELAALEKKLTDRLDVHKSAIVGVLRRVMLLLDPPPPPPRPPKPKIGFKP
jgi:hypothetical protein